MDDEAREGDIKTLIEVFLIYSFVTGIVGAVSPTPTPKRVKKIFCVSPASGRAT